MEILLEYYKGMQEGRLVSPLETNERLQEIDGRDYWFNYGVLVEHGLLRGEVRYGTTNTAKYVPTGELTSIGIKLVEDFIDQSMENLETVDNNVPSNTVSPIEKIIRLTTIWLQDANLYIQAADLLANLITQLRPS